MVGGQFGKDIHHHNARQHRLCQLLEVGLTMLTANER
jgi:hypothetical protein